VVKYKAQVVVQTEPDPVSLSMGVFFLLAIRCAVSEMLTESGCPQHLCE